MLKRSLHLSILGITMLALSACSSPTTQSPEAQKPTEEAMQEQVAANSISSQNIQGLWELDEELYFFAPDGQFISFTNNNLAGGDWKFEESMLILNIIDNTMTIREPLQLSGTINGDDMLLINQYGNITEWEREDNKVKYIESELYYLERIALPPEVYLEIKLTQNNNVRFLSNSISKKPGAVPFVFRAYYLEENYISSMPFEVEAIVTHENSFLFTAEEKVTLEDGMVQFKPIRLTQPNADQISELINEQEVPNRTLANTYWKLTTLNGSNIYKNFDTEPHIIFHQSNVEFAGEANGNDGCNSFFATWEGDDDSLNDLDIELGGSTMRLCNDDKLNRQVRDFMQALVKSDTYYIQGSTLTLKDNSDTVAIFEAVDL